MDLNYNNDDDNNNNDNNDDDDDTKKKNRTERRNSRLYNLLTAPRTVSNTYAQVAQAQSCADHVERFSRAACSVPLGTKGQLSY